MVKTYTAMKLICNGVKLSVTYDVKSGKYKLYSHTWDCGEHKKLLAKLDTMQEILWWIYNNPACQAAFNRA